MKPIKQPSQQGRKLKKWQVVLIVIGAIAVLGGIYGASEPAQAPSTKDSGSVSAISSSAASDASQIIELTQKDYEASAMAVENYKDLIRYPENHVGNIFVLEVKVQQKLSGGWFNEGAYYRCNADDTLGWWTGDEYIIFDDRVSDTTKILDTDIIRVYGEYAGVIEVTRALTNASDEVPRINMLYVEIIE